MSEKGIKPFVKWVGGKRQLLEILNLFLPEKINRYNDKGMYSKANKIEQKINNKILNEQNRIDKYREKVINKTEKDNLKRINKIQKNIKKNK